MLTCLWNSFKDQGVMDAGVETFGIFRFGKIRRQFLYEYLCWDSLDRVQKIKDYPQGDVLNAIKSFLTQHPYSSLGCSALQGIAEKAWLAAQKAAKKKIPVASEKWEASKIEMTAQKVGIPLDELLNVRRIIPMTEIFDDSLTCSICGDLFLYPCCLPNGHSFCFACLVLSSDFGEYCRDVLTSDDSVEWERVYFNRKLQDATFHAVKEKKILMAENRRRFDIHISHIQMLTIGDGKPPILRVVISFITKFVESVFRLTNSFPSIGNDEQGIELEWHHSASFCSTFANNSISVSVFDQKKHYVEEELIVSDYSQQEKDLLEKMTKLYCQFLLLTE